MQQLMWLDPVGHEWLDCGLGLLLWIGALLNGYIAVKRTYTRVGVVLIGRRMVFIAMLGMAVIVTVRLLENHGDLPTNPVLALLLGLLVLGSILNCIGLLRDGPRRDFNGTLLEDS